MGERVRLIKSVIKKNFARWLIFVVAFTALFYLVSLLSLIVRFGNLPNYLNVYDWHGNVAMIIQSTPSLTDTLTIIREEWLMEVGYMNYDYGPGISEWSLFLVPYKIIVVILLGMLLGTHYLMLRHRMSGSRSTAAACATGIGASFVGLTSITFSWVVCCSTPTWVVGLAMLGLGASTSLWLEPIGAWVTATGFALLLVGLFLPDRKSPQSLSIKHGMEPLKGHML